VKIISAIPDAPSMNKEEVNKFLESKLDFIALYFMRIPMQKLYF
jgi:hypothetical protein